MKILKYSLRCAKRVRRDTLIPVTMTPFFYQMRCWEEEKTCTREKLLLRYMSWLFPSKQWKRRLPPRSHKSSSSLQVLFVYEVLQGSHFSITSPLLGWLICFVQALLYIPFHVNRKKSSKTLGSKNIQYVHMLNGLNKIKASLRFTNMAMYCLCFYLWTPVPRYQSDFCLHSRTGDVKLYECVLAAGEINATQW